MGRREKILRLMEEKGINSQNELKKKMKEKGFSLSKNTISNVMNNDNEISNYTMESLSKFFECSLDYLKNDSIENSTNENIQIGKELGLSDNMINYFRDNKDFLGNMYLEKLLLSINSRLAFNNYLYDFYRKSELLSIVNYFSDIYCIKDKIIESYEGDTIIFIKFIDSIKNKFNVFYYKDYKTLILEYNVILEDIKESIKEIEKISKNKIKNVERLQNEIDYLEHLGVKLYETIYRDIKYIKFEIIDLISNSLKMENIDYVSIDSLKEYSKKEDKEIIEKLKQEYKEIFNNS